MARFDRMQVLNTMLENVLVPVFYHADTKTACKIADACAEGGARVIEFTNRGDGALHVFRALLAHCAQSHPQLVLGVGSVVDAPTAAMYIAEGANFIVGPLLNPEVAKVCNRRKVAYSPGCGSVSEISQAEELGVEIVKIFPGAQVGGPAFVKGVKGPMPWTRIMPTGGVDATSESIKDWLQAGVSCIGMGSKLVKKDWVNNGNYAAISGQVKAVLEMIEENRS